MEALFLNEQKRANGLTQSLFYSPAFDVAIFDNPCRIYFSQSQEGLALQIYFPIQFMLQKAAESSLKLNFNRSLYLLVYPNHQIYETARQESSEVKGELFEASLGPDRIIGLRHTFGESEVEWVKDQVEEFVSLSV